MWNSWAESRTDEWRAAMVRAVLASDGSRGSSTAVCRRASRRQRRVISRSSSSATRVREMHRSTCFAIVLLSVANQPDVRFVVISSDVVYPDRRDEGLRGEVLAAVQGRDQAGVRHSRQS